MKLQNRYTRFAPAHAPADKAGFLSKFKGKPIYAQDQETVVGRILDAYFDGNVLHYTAVIEKDIPPESKNLSTGYKPRK